MSNSATRTNQRPPKQSEGPEPPHHRIEDGDAVVKRIRVRVALTVYVVMGLFLFSSEFVNAVFNNRLDSLGASLSYRIAFAFKPTVVILYIAFAAILYLLIITYLRPLLHYLRSGEGYAKARMAAINVPWAIIIFLVGAWTIGTTAYYFIQGWEAESGIPYGFGILLKIGIGLPSAIYTAILLNLILVPAKRSLAMTTIGPAENDLFSRYRDFFAIAAIAFFMTSNYTYITYYFALADTAVSVTTFHLPMLLIGLFYGGLAVGLISLSKHEYFRQIESVGSVLDRLATGHTIMDRRMNIINFNELGDLAVVVNRVLDNFSALLAQISETAGLLSESSQRLATVGQQNAAHSNQQAAAAGEIVSTMEGVNQLSVDIGRRVQEVERLAIRVKEGVQDGFRITQDNIGKMQEVTQSYGETIGGMKNLGDQITGIWEIVKMINGIAAQIKIIAFNAALEASAAGDAGKSFEIVAVEIRRLADSTTASTGEIRARIGDIQQASDALIESGETDNQKIQEAWQMSKEIEAVFETILESSEATSAAAVEMSGAVEQQIGAFEQVLMTTRQIAEGIQDFAGSVEESSFTAETLEQTVLTLNTIVEQSTEKGAGDA